MDREQSTVEVPLDALSSERVEEVWADLLKAEQEQAHQGLVRTHTRTLVILTAAGGERPDVARVALSHPGRYITVTVGPTAASRAAVSLLRAPGLGAASELVDLPLTPRAHDHWAEAVLPLLRPDMPVAGLVTDLGLLEGDAFCELALNLDTVVLDTRGISRPSQPWARVFGENPRVTPMDLAWHALQPWREVTAAAFDPDDLTALLPALEAVVAVGGPEADSPATWLHGWLVDRTERQQDEPALEFSRHGGKSGLRSLELRFAGDAVCRIAVAGRQLRAEVEVHGRVVHAVHQAWSEPDWSRLVSDCLAHGYDAVFHNTVRHLVDSREHRYEEGTDA